MQSIDMNELEQTRIEVMIFIGIVFLFHMASKIAESYKKGGIKCTIKETVENLFLWFLLFLAFWNLIMTPTDADDEISAGILFIAFGVCRIAKHMAKKI